MLNRMHRLGMVLALVALAGCASTASQLTGTWVMLDDHGEPTNKIKLLTEDHFAFGAMDGRDVWAGGGTWELADDVYFETIDYHVHRNLIGETLRFDCRLEDGMWYHEGRFEAGGRKYNIVEIWKRLDE